MSIPYLWLNREKPPVFTRRWLRVWAKRVLNLQRLISISLRRLRYRTRGATIGHLSVFGELDFNGPARRLFVGERSFIGTGVHLALHAQIVVGNRVVINNGVHLLTASHDTRDPQWPIYAKPIVIDDFAWLAYNAIVLPGVRIGTGAVVGAGAVVSRDVPAFAVVAGNPAKVVGHRSQELAYSPVDLCAAFEAWLGRSLPPATGTAEIHLKKCQPQDHLPNGNS